MTFVWDAQNIKEVSVQDTDNVGKVHNSAIAKILK